MRSTAGDRPRRSALDEPFQTYFDAPRAGGALAVASSGPQAAGTPVALALHGMTGTHMVYRTLARELGTRPAPVRLLAPDLRGRGSSAQLPSPYGMDAHVNDLIAVLDHAGVDRAMLIGHSMGCNFAARLAADHPERCAGVLLLDSGVPLVSETVVWGDGTEDTEPHGIFDRFDTTFANGEEYLRGWREHPALKAAWDDDIETFARRDFVEDANGARCVANFDAVLADVNDLLFDGRTWKAVTRVRTPVRLMRAERGMYDDHPLIPLPELEAFLEDNPHVSVDLVPSVNHFTLLIGGGDGPRRVADAVGEMVSLQAQ